MEGSAIATWVWRFAKKYKWAFLLSYLVLLFELFFSQILPLFLQDVVNAAVYNSDLQLFFKSSFYYATVFLLYAACGFVQLILWQRLHNNYVYDIRLSCYKKVLHLLPQTLSNIKTGDIIKTLNSDVSEFHHIIQRFGMRVVNAGIGTVVSLFLVATMRWEIALYMIVIIPISGLLSRFAEKRMKKVSDEIRNKQGKYTAWLMEILKGIREVKLFVAEKTVLKYFMQKNQDIMNSAEKQDWIQFRANQIINGVYFISTLFFYIFSAIYVVDGQINIGEYVSIASYFSMVTNNMKQLLHSNVDYQKRKTSIERVVQLLNEEDELDNSLQPLRITLGEVSLSNVSFSYDPQRPVLKNLDLHILPGQRIGVVGQSGVGKSTLANLFLKFFKPQSGEICVDGQDLSSCSTTSIRDAVGIVNQEYVVFNGSVRDNITFGAESSDILLWEILEKVQLKEVVARLPQGLDTILGDGTINLSGGQNQRLCIARLFFKNPKIVILDEATSALDPETEREVQASLDVLAEGRTTIVISHKYKPLKNTDKVLVLHDGQAVGYDHYERLIKENKYFCELFEKQKDAAV